MSQIKLDLSQTVKEVSELNQAMQSLHSVAQNLFNDLGRLTQTFGQNLSQAQSSVQSSSPQMMTQTGDYAQMQNEAARHSEMIRYQAIKSAPSGAVQEINGDYLYRRPTTAGNNIARLSIERFNQIQEEQERQSQASQQQDMQRASQRPSSPEVFGPPTPAGYGLQRAASFAMPASSMAGIGYSSSDLPRILREQQKLPESMDRLNRAIESLSNSQSQGDKDMALALGQVKETISENSRSFSEAFKEYKQTLQFDQNDPRRLQAEQALNEAMSRAERDRQMAERYGGFGSGGGGTGGPGPFREFLGSPGASALAAGLYQGGMQATQFYYGFGSERLSRRMGAAAGIAGSRADIGQAIYQQDLSRADLTRPENIYRMGAPVLYGDDESTRYLGAAGYNRAIQDAALEEQNRRQIQQNDRTSGRVMTALGIGATAVGAGLLGAAAGPLAIGAAGALTLTGMGGTVAGLAREIFGTESDIDAFSGEGGLFTNIMDYFGDPTFSRGQRTEQERLLSSSRILQRAQQLQDANVREGVRRQRVIQDIVDVEQSERLSASLTGGISPGIGAVNREFARAAAQGGATLFERLEMSPAELTAAAAQASVAFRGRRSLGQTADLIELSRAGVGDLGALLGNVTQISQISGGQGDVQETRLRRILSQAVAAGFDNSRTSQQFAQSTAAIAQATGVTNVAGMAAPLANLARTISGQVVDGRYVADELGLSLAQRGISDLAQVTGQRSGIFGISKVLGGAMAGFDIGSANLVQGSNLVQMQEYVRALESGEEISDPRLRSLMTMERLRGQDPTQARSALSQRLRASMAIPSSFISSALNLSLGGTANIESQLANIQQIAQREGTSSPAFRQAMQEYGDVLRAAGAGTELGEEAAIAFGLSKLGGLGETARGAAEKALRDQTARSNAMYQDPGRRSFRRFLDRLQATEGTNLRQTATMEDVQQFFDTGGKSLFIDGETVTDPSQITAGQLERANISKLDLVRSAEYNAMGTDVQKVNIMNPYAIAEALLLAQSGSLMETKAAASIESGATLMPATTRTPVRQSGGIK